MPKDKVLRQYTHDDGRGFSFELLKSRRKTLSVIISAGGIIQVRSPLHVPQVHIMTFLHSRFEWILQKQEEFAALPIPVKNQYRQNDSVNYLAIPLSLRIITGTRRHIQQHESVLEISKKNDDSETEVDAIIENWLRKKSLLLFQSRVIFWREKMQALNLPPVEIKVRKMIGRWGSCSRTGVLTFNIALAQKKLECVDYVVIHELCHLREFNHGPKFYELQSQYCPNWKVLRKELNGFLDLPSTE